jgi:Ca2+/H+ antiporter, TMEM165/GDT1 family
MNKKSRRKKIPLFILLGLVFIVVIGFVLMNLWNYILVPVLHVGMITFWQALGIFILAKILFSGGPMGGRFRRHNRQEWRKKMFEKWQNMTPEEREKFRGNMQNHCFQEKTPPSGETPATSQ